MESTEMQYLLLSLCFANGRITWDYALESERKRRLAR